MCSGYSNIFSYFFKFFHDKKSKKLCFFYEILLEFFIVLNYNTPYTIIQKGSSPCF